jgi:MFS family permease
VGLLSIARTINISNEMKALLYFGIIGGLGIASSDLYISLLPKFSEIFGVSSFLINLTLSLYFITTALGCVAFAFISRFYTHSQIHILSFLIFMIGGLIIAIDSHYPLILAGRMFQGLGVGIIQSNLISYIKKKYTNTLSQSFSFYSLGSELFCILAPMMGVMLENYFSWQAPFLFITCLSLWLFILSKKNFDHQPAHDSKEQLYSSLNKIYKNTQYLKYNFVSLMMNGLGWGMITITSYLYNSPKDHAFFYTGYSCFYALGNYLSSKKALTTKEHELKAYVPILVLLATGIIAGFFFHEITLTIIALFGYALFSGLTYGPILEKALQTVKLAEINAASSVLVLSRLLSSGIIITLSSHFYFAQKELFALMLTMGFGVLAFLFLWKDGKGTPLPTETF